MQIMERLAVNNHPIQPYFVLETDAYPKRVLTSSPISHFYKLYPRLKVNATQTPVIPDGTIDILFYIDKNYPVAQISGLVTKYDHIKLKDSDGYYFGIRLRAGIFPKHLKVSVKELMNKEASLYEVLEEKYVERLERFMEEVVIEGNDEIEAFMHWLYPVLFEEVSGNQSELLFHQLFYEILKRRGNIKVHELGEISQYSVRYIQKLFSEHMGFSPKKSMEIIRFQNAVENIKYNKIEDVIYDCGYYDQSHFIHTFKKFMALSPEKYVALLAEANYIEKIVNF